MEKTTFIYALCEPNSRTVRYIGKTSTTPQKRLKQHLQRSATLNNHLGCWLRKLLSGGAAPSLIMLREVPGDGSEAEMRYIRLARGCQINLVNSTDGGEGNKGHKHTPESLVRMSVAQTGKKRTAKHRAEMSLLRKGQKRSPETCENIRASKLGEKNGMFGKSPALRSPEILKALSISNSGDRNPNFGKKPSPETTAKRRASLKAFYARKAAQKALQ